MRVREDEALLLVGEAEERDAPERRDVHVEAPRAILVQVLRDLRLLRVLRERAQIASDERRVDRGDDLLRGILVPVPREARPQDRVTRRHLRPRGAERRHVDALVEVRDHLLDVDAGAPAVQAVKEHSVLERREGVRVDDVVGHGVARKGIRGGEASGRIWLGRSVCATVPRFDGRIEREGRGRRGGRDCRHRDGGALPGRARRPQFWKNLREGVESITLFTDDELLAAGESEHRLRDPTTSARAAPRGRSTASTRRSSA